MGQDSCTWKRGLKMRPGLTIIQSLATDVSLLLGYIFLKKSNNIDVSPRY